MNSDDWPAPTAEEQRQREAELYVQIVSDRMRQEEQQITTIMPIEIHDITACRCAMCECEREKLNRSTVQKRLIAAEKALASMITAGSCDCITPEAAAYCAKYELETKQKMSRSNLMEFEKEV